MHKYFLALAASMILTSAGFAGSLQPVELAPIKHASATLTVVASDGTERSYTPAELEAFPTYSLTTTTPWRQEPATFEGVLLTDVLTANGLTNAASVTVTAENDYSTVVDQNTWKGVQILVATRVDGRAHSRRTRGPIQFVIDMDTFTATDLASESTLVWMAARIEAEG